MIHRHIICCLDDLLNKTGSFFGIAHQNSIMTHQGMHKLFSRGGESEVYLQHYKGNTCKALCLWGSTWCLASQREWMLNKQVLDGCLKVLRENKGTMLYSYCCRRRAERLSPQWQFWHNSAYGNQHDRNMWFCVTIILHSTCFHHCSHF